MSISVYLHSMEINSVEKDEYENFIKNYNNQKKNLCINKKTGEKTQELSRELIFVFKNDKVTNKDCILLFYSDTRETNDTYTIVSFALIYQGVDKKYMELKLLCSNNDSYMVNKKTIGVLLLDHIYESLLPDDWFLFIRPSTQGLIPYYLKWKKPILPMKMFDSNMTYGYLTYCKQTNYDILLQHLTKLDYFINYNYILLEIYRELKLSESEIIELNKIEFEIGLQKFKDTLEKKINAISDPTKKTYYINSLGVIQFRNISELKQFISYISQHSGGKYGKKYKSKKYKRKFKYTKKRK